MPTPHMPAVRVPADRQRRVVERCAELGITVTDAVNSALDAWLNASEPSPEQGDGSQETTGG